MLMKFNSLFYELNETSTVFEMLRKEKHARKHAFEDELIKNDTHNLDSFESSNVRDILIDYMNDDVFKSFAVFAIDKMLEYNFDEQASVNIFNKNDGRPIKVKNEKLTSYEIFAKVSLLEHTSNVITEYKNFMNNKDFVLSEEDSRILALSCLFHDFGKCIKLAKAYNLYNENMTSKRYKHEHISSQLIGKFIISFQDNILIIDKKRNTQIEKLKLVVSQHHAVSFTVIDPLTKYLKQIDTTARAIEYEKLID